MNRSRRTLDEILADRTDTDSAEFQEEYEKAGRELAFAKLVYDLRIAANLTQRQLAERMGTTASAISRLEGGGTTPTFATLDRLAAALGVGLVLTTDNELRPEATAVRFGRSRAAHGRPARGSATPSREATATRSPLPSLSK